jgi:hypothetical protein
MSLGVIVKGSEGIVLAADSRVSLQANQPNMPAFLVTFDNATKLLTFAEPHNYVGAVTWGNAVIGTSLSDLRTAQSFVPEFEVTLPKERIAVADFAQRLSDFFLRHWQAKMPPQQTGSEMVFSVGGYDEGEAYGRVYLFTIPTAPDPVEQSANAFGITLGGQNEHVGRLIQGYDVGIFEVARQALQLSNAQVGQLQQALLNRFQLPIPYAVLPLQDCIDLAMFFIKMTISLQNLSIALRGVGGAIDVAVITQRRGLQTIQSKQLVGDVTSAQRK